MLQALRYCVTVFKALHGMAPGYIADLCLTEVIRKGDLRYDLRRNLALDLLRQDDHLAPESVTELFVFRDQLLGTVSLKLPESISLIPTLDSFKRQLKTYLFGM